MRESLDYKIKYRTANNINTIVAFILSFAYRSCAKS